MQITRLHKTDPIERMEQIAMAADFIRRGGIVVVATETYYALATDPRNLLAVRSIYELKGRPSGKPIPLIADSIKTVEKIARLRKQEAALASYFWPGSLTLLVTPVFSFPQAIVGTSGKIGIRVPPSCPALELAEQSGGLITATSANLSGDPAASSVNMIPEKLSKKVNLVLDSGETPGGKASTVAGFMNDSLKIIRKGLIEERELMEVLALPLTK